MKKIAVKHHHIALTAAVMAMTIIAGSSINNYANADVNPDGTIITATGGDTSTGGTNTGKNDQNTGHQHPEDPTGNPHPQGEIRCNLMVTPLMGMAPLTVNVIGVNTPGTNFVAIHRGDASMQLMPPLNAGVAHTYMAPGSYMIVAIISNGSLNDPKSKKAKCTQMVHVRGEKTDNPNPSSTGNTNPGRTDNVFTGNTWTGYTATGIKVDPKNPRNPKLPVRDIKPVKNIDVRTNQGNVPSFTNSKDKVPTTGWDTGKKLQNMVDGTSVVIDNKEYKMEYATVQKYVNKTVAASTEVAIKSFIADSKQLRVAYQDAANNGSAMTKEQWDLKVDNIITAYKLALAPAVNEEMIVEFETFMTKRAAAMRAIYDRLDLIRKVQMQKNKIGK